MTSPDRGPGFESEEAARAWEAAEEALRDLVLQCLDRSGLRPDHAVLDLGCGTGWTTRLIGAFLREGRAFGLDPSALLVDRARSLPAPPRVSFTQAPVEALPLADASLDRVFVLGSPLLQQAAEAVLAEAFRVLRPGGRFLALLLPPGLGPAPPGAEPAAAPEPAVWRERLQRAGFSGAAVEALEDRRQPQEGEEKRQALLLLGDRPDDA